MSLDVDEFEARFLPTPAQEAQEDLEDMLQGYVMILAYLAWVALWYGLPFVLLFYGGAWLWHRLLG